MASSSETKAQVARESERRSKLAAPTVAAGLLYLLSGIIIAATVNGAPSVGLLQGLTPALRGVANPAESPRAEVVKFFSHRAFALISGSVLAAIAIVALVLALLLLLDATVFRRPRTWGPARPLVLVGGGGLALASVANQVVRAIRTHQFAVGHNHTNHAVDYALSKGAAYTLFGYVGLLAGLGLAAGMFVTSLNAMRVGLLTRWMGILGMFTGVLILLPGAGLVLEIIPAFWIVMLGILFSGRWPNGEPAAWAAGEARPWPSQAQMRQTRMDRARGAKPATAPAGASADDVAPAPSRPAGGSSKRRRRKHGARR
ncbi:MAG TPA: hypothetical protein VGX51_14255 [Solirubrobacteraceae bacterium]|jgi:hypothetical protein|nr:hypothetical protein [Solirubrobacteraceae bacterium]